ncbi:MAG: 23S rRNA (pseudouridine(1915)-N(3))-methyltransferase RlmH [Bacteroidota bacterium]|nr:23S rRNA (pseudouridine(1915)-N(3))-methyltransferase RlmH [Bacteroidota bacterium]
MRAQIVLLCAERSRRRPIAELCSDYLHRLGRYNLHARVDECPACQATEPAAAREEQAKCLFARLRPGDWVVLLDERGRALRSAELAQLLERQLPLHRRIVFIIGGAYGVSDRVRQHADLVLALGPLTLPHELARVVLCEQLYRAMTILRGEPYHHGSTDE